MCHDRFYPLPRSTKVRCIPGARHPPNGIQTFVHENKRHFLLTDCSDDECKVWWNAEGVFEGNLCQISRQTLHS